MAEAAFDTLDAARRLKAAGIEAEHAEAIVDVMGQSVNQLVTREHFDLTVEHFDMAVEHFDLTVKRLDEKIENYRSELIARIDTGLAEVHARIDTGLAEVNAKIDTGLAEVHAKIDTGLAEVNAKIDTGFAGLRREILRAHLWSVGVTIGAITLATTILGMMLARGGGM